jgi:hypothetical protein
MANIKKPDAAPIAATPAKPAVTAAAPVAVIPAKPAAPTPAAPVAVTPAKPAAAPTPAAPAAATPAKPAAAPAAATPAKPAAKRGRPAGSKSAKAKPAKAAAKPAKAAAAKPAKAAAAKPAKAAAKKTTAKAAAKKTTAKAAAKAVAVVEEAPKTRGRKKAEFVDKTDKVKTALWKAVNKTKAKKIDGYIAIQVYAEGLDSFFIAVQQGEAKIERSYYQGNNGEFFANDAELMKISKGKYDFIAAIKSGKIHFDGNLSVFVSLMGLF